jgi:outer membrane protein TolC
MGAVVEASRDERQTGLRCTPWVNAAASAASCLLIALAGCKVGPDYAPPEMGVPDAWHQQIVEGLAAGAANLDRWWEGLDDPILSELIRRARLTNLDLRAAEARIREARALRAIAAGEFWPQVDGFGTAERFRLSEETAPPGTSLHGNLFAAGLDALWEPDVWGRIARSAESAQARLEAEIENCRDVLVLLFAEVAFNYLDVRTLQTRIGYAEHNVGLQKAMLELTRERYRTELAPELDVTQAELIVYTTEAAIPALRIQLTSAINRLGVLLGGQAGELHGMLREPLPIPDFSSDVAVGLPADLLRQRPDIRRAERDLAAYEQTVLLALKEVENAMVAFAEERDRYASLIKSVTAATRSVELFQQLYRLELTDFQSVLEVQRSLTVQQDQLAESQGNITRSVILLYRALGGGWEEEAAEVGTPEEGKEAVSGRPSE